MKIASIGAIALCAFLFLGTSQKLIATESSVEVVEVDASELKSTLAQGKVAVKFYAPWCGACKRYASIFSQVARENQGEYYFVQVNAANDKNVRKEYRIKSYPTTIVFEDGHEVGRLVGSKEKKFVEQFLASLRSTHVSSRTPSASKPRKLKRRQRSLGSNISDLPSLEDERTALTTSL